MQLTKNAVAALIRPAGKADHIEWDDALPGFGVRLRGKSKRWIVQYRVCTENLGSDVMVMKSTENRP